ncbi:Methylcytosine dioxygenase TET1 [Microtus ochrogaster]|uniref:Methylcytosine dioxygenase TET n=1 Tax=Microtus ochrogaster TaxID=79684 RepID=A0A8J6KYU6_MICOH|nr:Methylcytosine dioxygenase TET1 [Microtus ochrogaster]
MINGITVVCSLLHEDVCDTNNPKDEQFHILPLHQLADTEEFSSLGGMEENICSGAIKILQPSRKKQLCFNEPIPLCGKRRTPMMEQNKKPAPAALKSKRSFSSSDSTKSCSSVYLLIPRGNEEAAAQAGFQTPCTMPSCANVAAGAGIAQPGEAAPLPQPSLPIADTPLSSPSEQLPFLSCARELDSCQVEDGQHSEADGSPQTTSPSRMTHLRLRSIGQSRGPP